MKITPKKVKKILVVIGAILIVLYAWEYYCVTRPVGQCGSLCEKRSIIMGYYGDQPFRGYSCDPWYRKLWK